MIIFSVHEEEKVKGKGFVTSRVQIWLVQLSLFYSYLFLK